MVKTEVNKVDFPTGHKSVEDGTVYNEKWDKTDEVKKSEREKSEREKNKVEENKIDIGKVNQTEIEKSDLFKNYE